MQSGKIKHYNNDKGYGFIDVDDATEDVFFHISLWQFIEPPKVGQQVYLLSEYNDKQQLRATKLSTTPFDNRSKQSKSSSHRRPHKPVHSTHSKAKRNWVTTAITVLAILSAVLFGTDFLSDNTLPNHQIQNQQTQSQSVEDKVVGNNGYDSNIDYDVTNSSVITGDAQIDKTIALIKQGGPYPYPEKDGTTFYNREDRLPKQPLGYYKEYTVPTPNVSHRGARRIVTGGNPPTVYYLTVDHYESFKKLEVSP